MCTSTGRAAYVERFCALFGIITLLPFASSGLRAQTSISASFFVVAPDSGSIASITVFQGGLDETGKISRILASNPPTTDFIIEKGLHFSYFYNLFTRPNLPSFNGHPIKLTLTAQDRPDAYVEMWNQDGTSITVASAIAPVNRDFSGPTAAAAAQSYQNYFGSSTYLADMASIQNAINSIYRLVAGAANLTDGSPAAATNLIATNSFEQFAFTPLTAETQPIASAETQPTASAEPALVSAPSEEIQQQGSFGFSIYADNSHFRQTPTDNVTIRGQDSRLVMPFYKQYSATGTLRGSLGLHYATVEGIRSYCPETTIGYVWNPVGGKTRKTLRWRVTPNLGLSYGFLRNSAAGSSYQKNILGMIGVTSVVDYRAGKNVLLSIGNQFTAHKTLESDVTFLPAGFDHVEQQVLKNGVRVRWQFSHRWVSEAGVIDTRFLQDAFLKSFQSYSAGLSYRITRTRSIGFGGKIEDGRRYYGWNLSLSSCWNF